MHHCVLYINIHLQQLPVLFVPRKHSVHVCTCIYMGVEHAFTFTGQHMYRAGKNCIVIKLMERIYMYMS